MMLRTEIDERRSGISRELIVCPTHHVDEVECGNEPRVVDGPLELTLDPCEQSMRRIGARRLDRRTEFVEVASTPEHHGFGDQTAPAPEVIVDERLREAEFFADLLRQHRDRPT